jgi:hypothetical protein
MRDAPAAPGDGCAKFVAIEPRGYVCADARTTDDPSDPELQAIASLAPRRESPWPFEYGEARETPRYWTVPSAAEQRRREWHLDDHLAKVARLREGELKDDAVPVLLRGIDTSVAAATPPDALAQAPVVHEYLLNIKAGSTIAWASQFDAQGRTWLVTPDLAIVPKDKVAPFAHATYHGVTLGKDASLPIAFVRQKPATLYARGDDGSMRPNGAWPRLSWAGLTGRQETAQGRVLLETTEQGAWIEKADATVASAASHTPWGEPVDGTQGQATKGARPRPPDSRRKTWLEVSVHGGWMIAYEGTHPVFATLVSPGRGRTLRSGDREETESATPPGVFSIQGKYLTSTMAVTDIVHFDVTFAMPYSGTIALHSAYWHERWGEKASMGCVNLSPIDALWLFRWAEPELPAGWHGVSAYGGSGYATVVVVHG